MKHYRQIIINILVDDDLHEEKLDEIVQLVKDDLETNVDVDDVKIVGVRVN